MSKAITQLDVGWSDDAEPIEANAPDEVRAFLSEFGFADDEIDVRIEQAFGPGGGAIVASFVGERDVIERLSIEYERRASVVPDGAGGWTYAPLDDETRAYALENVHDA